MKIPALEGFIARRILVNFRVDPHVIERILPEPFRVRIVGGCAMAGICLIRLEGIRPRSFPRWMGFESENAAHRIAVEWSDGGEHQQGVYISRRDTSSTWNALVGGRLFPGVHHRASFHVVDQADRIELQMRSLSGETHVAITARIARSLEVGSVFRSLDEASEFFRGGSLGYSASSRPGVFDGLELRTQNWQVQPLAIEHLSSSWFADASIFPAGSVAFDCALLMRGIGHSWHSQPELVGRDFRRPSSDRAVAARSP
jgi:hypothetical protein